jgi:CDP-diacylglycerol--glycerol-3-phosphate 3-phosphatidyltransferase
VSIFSPLQPQAKLYLWQHPNQTPSKQRLLPSARLRELLGVFHAKIHVFDDVTILSGANLSESYFTSRKDRYMVIKDAAVADFYHSLLLLVSQSAYRMGPDDMRSPHISMSELRQQLEQLFSATNNQEVRAVDDREGVFLQPTSQLGVLQWRQDEELVEEWVGQLEGGRAVLTSGYFNLTRKYEQMLFDLATRVKEVTVMVSSPQSNAWFNAQGMSRHVPNGYSWLEYQFLRRVSLQRPVKVTEYSHGDWSYHCKGLWHFGESADFALTIIGSANFGFRSSNLDLESQAILFSQNPTFRRKLEDELAGIEQHCVPVEASTVGSAERRPPLFWRLLLPLIKRYM